VFVPTNMAGRVAQVNVGWPHNQAPIIGAHDVASLPDETGRSD
jgi:hypothetical protein